MKKDTDSFSSHNITLQIILHKQKCVYQRDLFTSCYFCFKVLQFQNVCNKHHLPISKKHFCQSSFTSLLSYLYAFLSCRKTQATFDNCIKEHFGQDRPELGYFSKVRLHKTCRPRPTMAPHIMPERVPDPPSPEELRKPTDKLKNPHFTAVI